MLFKKENIGLNFIHNPRCGGRFVKQLLDYNGFSNIIDGKKVVKYKVAEYNNKKYNTNYQYMHWHYDLIKNNDYPKVLIIRDPMKRFISTSIRYGHLDFNLPYDTEDNWFRPQKHFYGKDVNVWNMKNGLSEKFCEWLSNILNSKITSTSGKSYKTDKDFGWIKKKNYSDSMINKAKKYYQLDYDFFDSINERF